jgi:hypothetical protein
VRPTVSEQLSGLSRILREAVAPNLADPYPIDILEGVCGTLDMLASAAGEVPAFQEWDVSRSRELLDAVGIVPSDAGSLDERQDAVRQALADAVPVFTADPELLARLTAFLRERATRYPLVGFGRPPAPTPK